MNESGMLLLALVVGFLLGVFFFAGLWWTIQKGVNASRPAVWFFSSLLIRTGITLSGFYGVAAGHGLRFLTCLLGFILARLVVDKITRPKQVKDSLPAQE